MKKKFVLAISILLMMAMLAGCGSTAPAETPATEAPAADPVVVETKAPVEVSTEAPEEIPAEEPAEDEEDIVYEGDASSYYIDAAYSEQIGRYYPALVEKWNEDQYNENGMCEVLAAYYDGNPLENVGFGFVDLDNDGHWELVIGAIQGAEDSPAVFEIWTLVDGKPVMLAQANARCQYSLVYAEEDNMWYVANERSSGSVHCHGTYYMMLTEGKFEVMQGVIYNADADDQNPWFLTYDTDWDASNDEPIDEDMAYAIRESHQQYYVALEYFPYIYY